jgi:hypothetical protein
MALARKDARTLLEKAQAAKAALVARIEDLTRQREAALIGDDDSLVARLDSQIEEA